MSVTVKVTCQEKISFKRRKPWVGPGSHGIIDHSSALFSQFYQHCHDCCCDDLNKSPPKICFVKTFNPPMKLRTASIPSGWFPSRIRSGHARCGREGRWLSPVWNKQTSVKQKKKGKGSPHNVEGVYTNSKWKQYSFVILSGRCWSSVGLGVMVGVGDRLPPQPIIMTGSADWLLWSNVEPGRERVGVGMGGGGLVAIYGWISARDI